MRAKHVIWAAGEFQYPRLNGFVGSELCRHTATIASYEELDGDDFIIVGGYESGVDAAYHLAYRDKRVRLFDKGCPWKDESSDPSVALSTYSLERMREDWFEEHVELFPQTPSTPSPAWTTCMKSRRRTDAAFNPTCRHCWQADLREVTSWSRICSSDATMVIRCLSEHDESTIVPGVFLCGPAVRHENHVFCFIYKYRQRFAVVAKAIATSLGLPAEGVGDVSPNGACTWMISPAVARSAQYVDEVRGRSLPTEAPAASSSGPRRDERGKPSRCEGVLLVRGTKPSCGRALRVEWLGQTVASVCWIASVLAYGISSSGDWLQICAASAWLLANIATIASAEEER